MRHQVKAVVSQAMRVTVSSSESSDESDGE